MERFKKIYQQGKIDVIEIWVDTQTGVNYVFHRNGNASGFTPLLDKDGKPIVSQQCYKSEFYALLTLKQMEEYKGEEEIQNTFFQRNR